MTESSGGKFTLAELLVVLLVVFAAGVFAIPLLRQEREMSHRTKCLGNQKQIGTGLALYCSVGPEPFRYGRYPPTGPFTSLYDEGQGVIGDPRIFVCPTADSQEPHSPGFRGDYVRDLNWGVGKPNKVIFGDAAPNHHYEAFVLTFRDGHCVIHKGDGRPPWENPVNNVKGTAVPADSMYSGEGDSDSSRRTWLSVRD